jgi:hypothetical protein
MFYDGIKQLIVRNDEQDIEPIKCKFSVEAKKEWVRIFNKITNFQNNEDENEYLKSMYPKQKSYIPRFALLLNAFHSFFDKEYKAKEIHLNSIKNAEKLSDYFILNAKKVKIESTEVKDIKSSIKNADTTFDKFKQIYEKNPEFNRTVASELLEVSKRTIYRWIKDLEK